MPITLTDINRELEYVISKSKYPNAKARLLSVLKGQDLDLYQFEWRRHHNIPKRPHKIMLAVNDILNGYGVETLNGRYVDAYYFNSQASYVNMGDTYIATILHDHEENKFIITSWGNFMECHPDRFPEGDRQ